jgi:hypothetical protein
MQMHCKGARFPNTSFLFACRASALRVLVPYRSCKREARWTSGLESLSSVGAFVRSFKSAAQTIPTPVLIEETGILEDLLSSTPTPLTDIQPALLAVAHTF